MIANKELGAELRISSLVIQAGAEGGELAPDPAKVGERIRRLRTERGLSQRDVAEPDMSAAYLSLIEGGQRVPSEQALNHIARRLEVEVEEIVTGKPSGLDAHLELTLQEARGLAYRGEIAAAEHLVTKITKDAARYKLTRLHARALSVQAGLVERRGQFSEARDLYDKAQNLLADEPVHMRFEPVVGYARCIQFLGDPRLGVHLLESYLLELRAQKMEDPTARMRTLSTLVHLYRAIGMDGRSTEAAEEAIALAPQVEDPEQVACMSVNVARSLLDQGRHDDAVDMLKRAEQIYQGLEWLLPQIRSKINRGIVEVGKSRLAEAKRTFSEVLDALSAHPQEVALRGQVLNQLGRVERLSGDFDAATEHLRRARVDLAEEDVFERAVNAREFGLCMAEGEVSTAEAELKRSADLFLAVGAKGEAGRSLLELGRLLRRNDDLERAAAILEDGLELSAASEN